MRILLLSLVCFFATKIDLKGQSSMYSDSITVYIFMAEECRICQYYANEFQYLDETFASDQISFVGLFPNRFSNEENIKAFQVKYDIPFVLKREYFQTKSKKFNVKVTPEVVVYDEKKEKILYQGRIDENYVKVGKRKQIVKKRELRETLQAIVSKNPILTKQTTAIGCFINYNN